MDFYLHEMQIYFIIHMIKGHLFSRSILYRQWLSNKDIIKRRCDLYF